MIRQHAVDVRVREIIRNYRNYTSNGTQRIRTQRRLKNSGMRGEQRLLLLPDKNCGADLIDCETVRTLRRAAAAVTRCRRGNILGRMSLSFRFFSTAGFIFAYMYVM